jgi:glycosyltransferase involved in cell wall biosynthesis
MITGTDITVVIPTHPARGVPSDPDSMLGRAVQSVYRQTFPPYLVIVMDADGRGAAATRNQGLDQVVTEWVAFLDSDDEFLRHHLEWLAIEQAKTGADVVYPGCRVVDANGNTVRMRDEWGRFTKLFDADLLRQASYLPVTSLVRTDLAKRARFGPPEHEPDSHYDDWGFYLRLVDLGAKFVHLPVISWIWHHHGLNTSGLPTQGDGMVGR